MTAQALIKILEKYPPTMEVFIDQRISDFRYGLLNGVTSKEIAFREDPNSDPLATATVIILSEE